MSHISNDKPEGSEPVRTTILFSISDRVGALDSVLSDMKELNVNMTRIESRPSITEAMDYDFFVEFQTDKASIDKVVESLKPKVSQVRVVSSLTAEAVPHFPRRIRDLDDFANKTLEYGEELSSDHPGFVDKVYRERREEITNIAKTYRFGKPIPKIEYTDAEKETWGVVYNKLTALYPAYACKEYNYIFPLLVQNCGYSADNIPQLEDISLFLKDCTGFTLRPVMGLLSSRDFLNGLAFRVFHSTQYIRHHSQPLYTPEPDVCHELLGHVPLFADPEFADFSQEIGLASLGASDDDIVRLATIYWFTVEFGVCRQDGNLKAFGAGLLSSFGELEYSVDSDKPERRPFEPSKVAETKYPITEYQPVYFISDSFKDAKEKVQQFARSLDRPFSVRYNPYTQSIEVLDKKEKITRFAHHIQSDISTMIEAISKLN